MTHNVEMPRINANKVNRWIEAVALNHGKRVGALTYVFCDDQYILGTNKQFLHHDYYTDIITFDYSNSQRISGDMVISLDTVSSNANLLGVDYNDELMRMMGLGKFLIYFITSLKGNSTVLARVKMRLRSMPYDEVEK